MTQTFVVPLYGSNTLMVTSYVSTATTRLSPYNVITASDDGALITLPDPAVMLSGTYLASDGAWNYLGTWYTYVGSGPYGDIMYYSLTPGNSVTTTFYGTQFVLIYTSAPTGGIFDVYVDGIKVDSINQYSALWVQQNLWTSGLFSSGLHTLTFVHLSGAAALFSAITITSDLTASTRPVIFTGSVFETSVVSPLLCNITLTVSTSYPSTGTWSLDFSDVNNSMYLGVA